MQELDGALGREEPAARDPAHAPALVGQLLAARQVDAGDLEERDRVCSEVEVVTSRGEQPVQERRAQDGQLGRDRLGHAQGLGVGIARLEAPGIGLGVAAADQRVLDEPP